MEKVFACQETKHDLEEKTQQHIHTCAAPEETPDVVPVPRLRCVHDYFRTVSFRQRTLLLVPADRRLVPNKDLGGFFVIAPEIICLDKPDNYVVLSDLELPYVQAYIVSKLYLKFAYRVLTTQCLLVLAERVAVYLANVGETVL